MGISIDLRKGNFGKIVSELATNLNIEDTSFLEKILLQFGEKFGDTFVLLNNEYWEDNNSFYSVASFIDRFFGVENSFNIILKNMEEANANWNEYEAAEELGVELNEEPEDS